MESQHAYDPQLEHFFAFSLDLFAMADMQGYFTRLNPAWEITLGYTLEELMSRPYLDFVHPDDKEATITEKEGLASGRSVFNFENRYLAKDNTWKWLSWAAVPQDDGTVYAVARDITHQRQEKQEILELLRKVEKINQQLDQFAFVVSHDLKSPLRAIMNLSEWIVEDLGSLPNPEVHGHLAKLKQRVESMYSMIDDLLQYSRIGRSQHAASPVDLNILIAEVKGCLHLPSGFEIRIPEPLPSILGRELELKHMFQNLLDNAIKYRKGQNDFVEITCKGGEEYWTFSIRDNGIGIHPQHHQRIFQLFQRLSYAPAVEGTGVGLALVKRIIELAGGQIWVTSAEGEGASFLFTWPVNPRDESL